MHLKRDFGPFAFQPPFLPSLLPLCGLSDALGWGNYFHSFFVGLVPHSRVSDPRRVRPTSVKLLYPNQQHPHLVLEYYHNFS